MIESSLVSATAARLAISAFALAVIAFIAPSETMLAAVKVELIDSTQPANSNAWPDQTLFDYEASAFAFTRLPQAYTSDGLRDEWPNPLLVRATAKLKLTAGRHRYLLRSRRAARLYLDGELIADTPFPRKIQDGHDPVDRPFIPLGPEVRFPGPGDQEKLVTVKTSAGTHHIRLEFYVGGYAGKNVLRPETGETLVALSLEGESGFHLLSPDSKIPLTDTAWASDQKKVHRRLDHLDNRRRQCFQATRNDYWKRRHDFARQILQQESPVEVPDSIDRLIDERIETANRSLNTSPAAKHFNTRVRPILNDHCLSCHGKKQKGGLRLDSLKAARAGGDSGEPAIVPHAPDRSFLIEAVSTTDEDDRMPPKGSPLSPEDIKTLRDWIQAGASWPESELTQTVRRTSLTEDWQFLRRVSLDTIGVPPKAEEVRSFLNNKQESKRADAIDKLLNDPRWADHWTSYWQDVLAENPSIVNPTLNNTGPFRWWIHDSFRDNKPMDRFVTELVMMGGSLQNGGPRGFEMASQNDVPMAAKANILTTAFLATQMKCSRCHDAPFHDNTQKDLFGLAAMLAQKALSVPKTSSVPQDKLHANNRKPLIEVTLKPGTSVEPSWAFPEWSHESASGEWLNEPKSTREQLAFHITSPHNRRFAKVIVNRLWQRWLGRGIVEPVDDWENAEPANPELLRFLADEFIRSGYDMKSVARLILNSEAYQRKTGHDPAALRLFAAPGLRRLSAEQIVDSLFEATGREMRTEALTVDIGGGRPWSNAINLGRPTRAWMFGGMANNRDRPSLILPRAQIVIDVLKMFGWRPSRQEPTSYRQSPLSPLQPAALNNSTLTGCLTRLSDEHALTHLALAPQSLDALIHELYLRILSRPPSTQEAKHTSALLSPGFENRVVPGAKPFQPDRPEAPPRFVTWANHLHPEATGIQLEEARKAKAGAAPSPLLESDWRERFEDVIWALINLPEIIYSP